jgi:hypothetical protein
LVTLTATDRLAVLPLEPVPWLTVTDCELETVVLPITPCALELPDCADALLDTCTPLGVAEAAGLELVLGAELALADALAWAEPEAEGDEPGLVDDPLATGEGLALLGADPLALGDVDDAAEAAALGCALGDGEGEALSDLAASELVGLGGGMAPTDTAGWPASCRLGDGSLCAAGAALVEGALLAWGEVLAGAACAAGLWLACEPSAQMAPGCCATKANTSAGIIVRMEVRTLSPSSSRE